MSAVLFNVGVIVAELLSNLLTGNQLSKVTVSEHSAFAGVWVVLHPAELLYTCCLSLPSVDFCILKKN